MLRASGKGSGHPVRSFLDFAFTGEQIPKKKKKSHPAGRLSNGLSLALAQVTAPIKSASGGLTRRRQSRLSFGLRLRDRPTPARRHPYRFRRVRPDVSTQHSRARRDGYDLPFRYAIFAKAALRHRRRVRRPALETC